MTHPQPTDPWEVLFRCALGAVAFLVIALAIVGFCVGRASAGDVTMAYERHFGGATQLNGHPIDRSEFDMDLTSQIGQLQWGAGIQAFQNGRAGQASDVLQLHVGYPIQLGRFGFTPSTIIGYGRGLNDDYGILGVSGAASFRESDRFSTEASVTYRHSFAVNYFALNSADLPHDPWCETAFEVDQVYHISPRVAVGISGQWNLGTAPDTTVGAFTRLTF